jgi:DNA-binding Xre family transcriptional regulator
VALLTYSYEKFLKQLGVKLRGMRRDRGWTYRDMIVDHGYHLAQWQNFEKGKGISVPSLLRLCEVFECSLEELTKGLGLAEAAAPREEPLGAAPQESLPSSGRKRRSSSTSVIRKARLRPSK